VPLVLGVDSSTQATKVEVRDADSGALVADGRAAHPLTTPPRSEQDPNAWWSALQDAMAGLPKVDAIAVAGQQHGMVALDEHFEPVRAAKLWNDTESAPDSQWLREQLPDAEWAQRCGSIPLAAFTITKLSWLHRSEPDAWARLARICLPHDWLTWKLGGAFVTDRGDASGTGYYSATQSSYDIGLLATIDGERDWAPAVPRVLGPLEVAGERDGVIVAAGTGDNMGAALGIGLAPRDIAISLGTSGTVFGVSDAPTADASGAVAGFADATGRFLPLVCTLNATKVTDAIARILGVDHKAFDALALSAEPGAGGTVLVPYFDGERTPNRPDARGTLAGLRSDVTREQVARASVEGVVCSLLDGFDALTAAGVVADGRVFLVGGGARSAAYQHVVADLLGRPVSIPPPGEYVAAGACRQAAAAWRGSWPEWEVAPGTVIEPRSVERDAIRARYAAARG
jgi:xylulokinase